MIERVSGKPLNALVAKRIFKPLGMKSTSYNPPIRWMARTAPTEMDAILRHHIVRGEVHDENCYTMGGVCGQAGLFSTAGDLAIYAQMLLNGGRYSRKRIFLYAQTGGAAGQQPCARMGYSRAGLLRR